MDVTRAPTGNWSRAPGPVADDLADELVTQHDVAIRVVQRPAVGSSMPASGWSMKCTSEAQIAVLNVCSESSPCPGTGSAVSRTVSSSVLAKPLHASIHIPAS